MTEKTVVEKFGPILRRIRRLPPVDRVAAIDDLYRQIREFEREMREVTTGAVRELHLEYTLAEIARMTNKSVTRIKQIEDGPDRVRK